MRGHDLIIYVSYYHPMKLTTVRNKVSMQTKNSQNVLSSDMFMYLVSGFICFLKQTIILIRIHTRNSQ